MHRGLQRIIQGAFLALFAVLIILGRLQLWVILFGGSVMVSFFLGRWYCGSLCPIHTAILALRRVKSRLGIKNLRVPSALQSSILRYGVLLLFITLFLRVMRSGQPLPILPALFALGVALSLVFPEQWWHRWLCPYGTVLHISSRPARKALSIKQDTCIDCGICRQVCPAQAVVLTDDKHRIEPLECLLCFECQRRCPVAAIEYHTR